MSYDYSYKIVTIGNSNIGKTSLSTRFTNEKFIDNTATIGVEYYSKNINLNNKIFKIQLWDTAGQEIFRSIIKTYYRQAVGVLLCYDITNFKSFNDLPLWLNEIKRELNNTSIFYLIGTKIDINKREVPKNLADKFALENNMKHFEVSSRSGENINEMFLSLINDIYEKFPDITNITGIKKFPIENLLEFKPTSKFKCCN